MHHEIGSGDGMFSLQTRASFLATDLGSALKATRPEVVALARKLRRRKPKGGQLSLLALQVNWQRVASPMGVARLCRGVCSEHAVVAVN
jgi:hypothetical protein